MANGLFARFLVQPGTYPGNQPLFIPILTYCFFAGAKLI